MKVDVDECQGLEIATHRRTATTLRASADSLVVQGSNAMFGAVDGQAVSNETMKEACWLVVANRHRRR